SEFEARRLRGDRVEGLIHRDVVGLLLRQRGDEKTRVRRLEGVERARKTLARFHAVAVEQRRDSSGHQVVVRGGRAERSEMGFGELPRAPLVTLAGAFAPQIPVRRRAVIALGLCALPSLGALIVL